MKPLLAVVLFAVLAATLLLSGCAYDGGGTGFSQRDLELQRRNAEGARGF